MSVVLEETKPESMFSIGGISFKSRASGARKETRDHGTGKEEELPYFSLNSFLYSASRGFTAPSRDHSEVDLRVEDYP